MAIGPFGAYLAQAILGFATFAIAAVLAIKLTQRFKTWVSVCTFFVLWIGLIFIMSGAFASLRQVECQGTPHPDLCQHDD